jgi:hypothetical protein
MFDVSKQSQLPEITIYELYEKRQRLNTFQIELDGQKVAELSTLGQVETFINQWRISQKLKWREVGVSYCFTRKRSKK